MCLQCQTMNQSWKHNTEQVGYFRDFAIVEFVCVLFFVVVVVGCFCQDEYFQYSQRLTCLISPIITRLFAAYFCEFFGVRSVSKKLTRLFAVVTFSVAWQKYIRTTKYKRWFYDILFIRLDEELCPHVIQMGYLISFKLEIKEQILPEDWQHSGMVFGGDRNTMSVSVKGYQESGKYMLTFCFSCVNSGFILRFIQNSQIWNKNNILLIFGKETCI